MTFNTAPGHAGNIHESAAEAEASFILAQAAIVKAGGFLPLTFADSNGEAFRAKPDFQNAPTGVWFEFKVNSLNGVASQATSRSQLAGSLSKSATYKAITFGWNHSAEKVSITQASIAEAGRALVLVFAKTPDASTIKRLNSRNVFWLVLGSPQWRQFTSFLKLASHGLPVSMTYSHPESGKPLHEFRTEALDLA
jgi:hypothetical protein